MTLVLAHRVVAEASLVRGAPDGPSYHGLDRVGLKLARGLGEYMAGLMAAPVAVSVSAIRIEDAPATSGFAVRHVRLTGLEASLALAVDRAALMRLVDLYYGGEGLEDAQRERLSAAEIRFFARIAAGVCELLPAAWQSFASFAAELDEDLGEDDAGGVALQAFSVIIGDRPPFEIECRYPVRMLEAVPGLKSVAPIAADPHSDHNWQARLMERALDVTFPVRAVFAQPELPLARLMRLRPGDIIPVCLPAQIDLTVAGLQLARGSAGESNGRAAICIEHL